MTFGDPPWPYKQAPPDDLGLGATDDPAAVGAAILRTRSRASRRTLGQFWTPAPIAELMVRWALGDRPGRFLDPAAGPLTFLAAADRAFGPGRASCLAFELDAALAAAVRAHADPTRCELCHADFLTDERTFADVPVVCNPPYTRHHGLRDEVKAELVAWAERAFGFRPSRFLGTYGWFLLRALGAVGPRARLCFITPVELLASRSGRRLFERLPEAHWPRRALVFGPRCDAFAGVDATAAVTFIDPAARDEPGALLLHEWPGVEALLEWLNGPAARAPGPWAEPLPLVRGLRFEARPAPPTPPAGSRPLLDFARVTRGTATGANSFFLFDAAGRKASGIPRQNLVRVIARARDARRLVLDTTDLAALEARGRPTWLLALRRGDRVSPAVLPHLAEGARIGLPSRPLLSRRRPWWVTEAGAAPPIVFTYLSRGDPRFVLNRAGAIPLTTFLALWPREPPAGVSRTAWETLLAATLNAPGTLASLEHHARAYGGATRKLEPRELEQIELPPLARMKAAAVRRLAARAERWLGEPDRERRQDAVARWEVELRDELPGTG
ncbi:MAG: hypothetical protein JXB32_01645 [Deltaproteobacteria bacterium]|nr:hypothetical protein [Deltaproteobacteria bacterium]